MRLPMSMVATFLLVACWSRTASAESGAPAATSPPAAARPALGARTGELVNPDGNAVVFLYYDLAGIPVPVDRFVEEDSRVKAAQPLDKAARRAEIKPEIESGAAGVQGVGILRVSLNSAGLSDYDPTYGEFTVRALAPSSVLPFEALGQRVSVRFGNAKTAQIWRVPEVEARKIRDKIGPGSNVSLDLTLKITGVQPSPGGGTIIADVVEYEMRETRTGLTIGRVQVTQR